MEHARTEYHRQQEEKSDSRVESIVDDSEEKSLGDSADEGQPISNKVEFRDLKLISIVQMYLADSVLSKDVARVS